MYAKKADAFCAEHASSYSVPCPWTELTLAFKPLELHSCFQVDSTGTGSPQNTCQCHTPDRCVNMIFDGLTF